MYFKSYLLEIIEFGYRRNNKLTIKWIPTDEQKADEISRHSPQTEAKIRPQIAKLILKHLKPNIDMFATRSNRLSQDIDFVSEYPTKMGVGYDAMAFRPKADEILYLFPPSSLVLPALSLIDKVDKAMMVVNIESCVTAREQEIQRHFDHVLTIGTNKHPAVLLPCKKKYKIDNVFAHFVGWDKVKKTLLYVKGFTTSVLENLAQDQFAGVGLNDTDELIWPFGDVPLNQQRRANQAKFKRVENKRKRCGMDWWRVRAIPKRRFK